MDKNKINKKGLILSIAIFLLLFFIYGFYLFHNKIEGIERIKVSDKFLVEKKYHDLVVTDIDVFRLNKYTHLSFNIRNDSDTNFEKKELKMIFLDEKGNDIFKENILIAQIPPKKAISMDMLVKKEMIQAYDFLLSDE